MYSTATCLRLPYLMRNKPTKSRKKSMQVIKPTNVKMAYVIATGKLKFSEEKVTKKNTNKIKNMQHPWKNTNDAIRQQLKSNLNTKK